MGSVDCFPTPNSHSGPQARGAPHYYTAELAPSSLPEATPFTVGDNHTYNGYWNSPLDPTKNYLIYFQAASNFRGVRTITLPDKAFVSGAQTRCYFVLATLTVNLDLCQASRNGRRRRAFIAKWTDVCTVIHFSVGCLVLGVLVNLTSSLKRKHENSTKTPE